MDEATAARIEIAALLAACSTMADAGDIEGLARLFAPDGVYRLPDGTEATGPEAIAQMLSELAGDLAENVSNKPAYMRHHITTSHIEVADGGEAQGDTYFLNVNDRGLDHWGRWHDRFGRSPSDGWRFTRREVVVEGMAETSWLHPPD